MHTPNILKTIAILVSGAVFLAGCDTLFGGSEGGSSEGGGGGNGEQGPAAGDPDTFTAAGISMDMHFVPGGITFPTGTDDSGSSSVANDYWIAKTEVTYELWYAVREWAENGTGGATGEGQYSFANAGREGNDGTVGAAPTAADQEPVTTINWRDAMAWTNALTEWYNAQTGSGLEPVYYTDSGHTTPIRSVDDSDTISWESGSGTNDGSQDDPFIKADADGFRLPGTDEWELAARFIEDANGDGDIADTGEHYPGDYASGADSAFNVSPATEDLDGDGDQDVTDDVAWYSGNASSQTHPVAGKNANALGLHDMSGNVWEWNLAWIGSYRAIRGGMWNNAASNLRVGYEYISFPYDETNAIGFRPARNAE